MSNSALLLPLVQYYMIEQLVRVFFCETSQSFQMLARNTNRFRQSTH